MKRKALWLIPAVLLFAVTGCGSGQDSAVKDAASTYAKNSMSGNWSATMKESTGEQLSVLSLLSEQLSQLQFQSKVRLVDVLEVHTSKTEATALVHIVRDMDVKGYGTMTDDRQVLYHMYNVNGDWKVYRVDVVQDK